MNSMVEIPTVETDEGLGMALETSRPSSSLSSSDHQQGDGGLDNHSSEIANDLAAPFLNDLGDLSSDLFHSNGLDFVGNEDVSGSC